MVLTKAAPGKATCTGLSGGVMRGAGGPGQSGNLERTLLAGRGINQSELAGILCEEAPARLNELMGWGIKAAVRDGFLFARGRPPVMGEEIVRCLIRKNMELGTRFMGKVTAADLVMENGVAGLIGFEQQSGGWLTFSAGAVVLATGGAAALYFRHDNPGRMLGDGYVLAIEAGALLQDMEFVQFYPVCLAEPGHAPLVIPPRLADRGLLVNDGGEDILKKYGIDERPAAEGPATASPRRSFGKSIKTAMEFSWTCGGSSRKNGRTILSQPLCGIYLEIASGRSSALFASLRQPTIPWVE